MNCNAFALIERSLGIGTTRKRADGGTSGQLGEGEIQLQRWPLKVARPLQYPRSTRSLIACAIPKTQASLSQAHGTSNRLAICSSENIKSARSRSSGVPCTIFQIASTNAG